jgi:hypothetical protein
VAIVQISRITQRKGLLQDLPQPLAGAELGWAIDDRRLFIGNGDLADGAPVVGNTEVLTEFSDILSFAGEYTYQGTAGGYTVQTGVNGDTVSQSLQSRLDSYAVITDFGATGDGVTDVTEIINNALYQMYCRDVNPQIRRSLFFPAGTYIISDTLLIPPSCKLYGEGPESSIIYFYAATWTNTISYASGVLVQNGATYYRSQSAVPIGTAISNATYWTAETLPSYIIRTADSLQQTGANIGTNGALPPGFFEITAMKFQTDQATQNGVYVEAATDCSFESVNVEGPMTAVSLTTAANATACVRWNSTGSYICKNVEWNHATLSGMVWGTNTDEQIEGVTFSNCYFDTLYQGVYLGNTVAPAVGPTGFRIVQNQFDNIYVEGIVIVNVSLNASAYNVFYDVGNHFNGTTNPASSIIDINAINNISVGDAFERTTTYSNTFPRIKLNNTNSIALGMNMSYITFYQNNVANLTFANQLALGTYQRSAGIQDNLTVSGSAQTLFTFDADDIAAVKIDYTTKTDSDNAVRTGTYIIVRSTSDSTGALASSDTGVQNSATGVTFTVSEVSPTNVISWKYTTTSSGTIYYSVTKLA